MDDQLTSVHNPLVVKFRRALRDARFRDKHGIVVVEGFRLVRDAFLSGWLPAEVIYTAAFATRPEGRAFLDELRRGVRSPRLFRVSDQVFQSISEEAHPQGIMAVGPQPHAKPESIWPAPAGSGYGPFLVALAGVQDPGNLGTIVRVADAAGVSGILVTRGTADPWAPKAVRAAMGSTFHVPVVLGEEPGSEMRALQAAGVVCLGTSARGHIDYRKADYRRPVAIWLGNEGNGLSAELLALCDDVVSVPIYGRAESLNVSTAAAVVLYEAASQREGS